MRLEIENKARRPKPGEAIIVLRGGELHYGVADPSWLTTKETAIIVTKDLDNPGRPTHRCPCELSDEWHKEYDKLRSVKRTM